MSSTEISNSATEINKLTGRARSLANLKPYKPGETGNPNGQPKIPPEIKAQRKEARQILKEAAPWMAQKILDLAASSDPDIAIKALKVAMDKILPNLEEVDNFEHRELQQFDESQLESKLADIRSRRSSDSQRTEMPS